MLLRLLILIFVFNAFIPSAFAMGLNSGCMQMDDTNSSMIMSHGDSDMTCHMSDMDKTCSEMLCASSCLASIATPLPFYVEDSISLMPANQPLFKTAFFYQIYPSINTPPPLV